MPRRFRPVLFPGVPEAGTGCAALSFAEILRLSGHFCSPSAPGTRDATGVNRRPCGYVRAASRSAYSVSKARDSSAERAAEWALSHRARNEASSSVPT